MKIKKLFYDLVHEHTNPEDIALGVAMGVFIGTMPLYVFHFIIMVISALIVRRANKVAIFIGTNISLPPTVPFITWAGYNIGRLILSKDYPDLQWAML
jgi:hypothetical protein